jgi:hypothetical protein
VPRGRRRGLSVYVLGSVAVGATMAAGFAPAPFGLILGVIAVVAAVATFVVIVVLEIDEGR